MLLLAFLALGSVTYSQLFSAEHFSDDFLFIFADSRHPVSYWLIHGNPYNRLIYRPIEAVVYASAQDLFGAFTVLPLHLANFVVHTVLAWIIVQAMRHAGFRRTQSLLAGLYFLLSEIQVEAVAGLDTLSQVLGAAFGFISVTLLWKSLWAGTLNRGTWRAQPNRRWLASSIAAFVLALLSKETSFGFSFAATLLIAIWAVQTHGVRAVRAVRYLAPFAVSAVSIAILRWIAGAAGPRFGVGRYDVQFGSNITTNLLAIAVGWTLPFSSVDVYRVIGDRNVLALAWIGVTTAGFVLAMAWGVRHSPRHDRRAVAIMLALALSALTPAIFMHVSELYVYNSMPYVSILVGVGLGTLLQELRWDRAHRAVAASSASIALAILVLAHGMAVREKVLLMKRQGDRATNLLNQAAEYARQLPARGTLILVPEQTARRAYSVFLMDGFDTLDTGARFIKPLSKRSDIDVKLAINPSPGELLRLKEEGTVVWLSAEGTLRSERP
jgi:hypothetical protein